MASWLKVAEDLFEVVDRRAKLVVSELADEQSSSQGLGVTREQKALNAEGVYSNRRKSKDKDQSKPSIIENPTNARVDNQQENNDKPASYAESDEPTNHQSEHPIDVGVNDEAESSKESLSETSKDPLVLEIKTGQEGQNDDNMVEVQPNEDNMESSASFVNEDVATSIMKNSIELSSSPLLEDKEIESISNGHALDDNSNANNMVNEETSLTPEKERSGSEKLERENAVNAAENEREISKSTPSMNKQQENLSDSHVKVQDQLDEAQGLLKSAVKTGQSKEARLARVCAGLSTRLQEYKAENKQLEELLVSERELNSSYEAHIKQLQQDLSLSKTEAARVEANMSDALAAKNSEIETLVNSLDALKKEAAASEGTLASLQQNDMDTIRRGRELTETRVIQALREEIASAERRAEEERAAHNATKMAAVEREVELEHRAVESSNALARIQRAAEESTSRAAELEHKLALLEVENSSLNQELQDLEARNRREQKKSSEEANQILQMQAWQEEVDRARRGQRDAENKISYLEAELQKMRVEMAGIKRDSEHYSRQEHMELEKRYRELTDLLYHKQTQLETMTSEKAALEFQLIKEQKHLQELQIEAERSRVANRASTSWEEDTDIKALEPLPLYHRHMIGAHKQLQRAAKILDSGAVRATRFLWRYPTARVILLCYLVFVHLFLMYLLHHLQEQADRDAAKEVAASMGLKSSLA
ncbi:golgin-84-like isoform X1 [Zingiber officinale]|uniref:golgin-84-like isoform X1 n=1 Tax=Zingiber officinale TaxID=94328 RepID=UPI001C4CAEB0|nr:golgin-84-like isoform X1 [Zingiber officinale]